ncbi:PAS domain-containing protein [Streptomyces sp. NBC_01724]|uniref:PAS domain-containing protein n=1 Tax=unclassified Streptomyces TaxID=2593676 RepID=UPI002E3164F4|nr:PAS domain-containing protein [Streptomyces sp. NBC_01724]WTE56205.1 PAS domain-containing protein [Streptomyces sp. NBC_01620]WTE64280.1 PAS domain-containing protein [Streptomyces sp. NBC_01617]WTI91564.1 PAS domain-containing protein [Streptomyces sp. NBC_00724]
MFRFPDRLHILDTGLRLVHFNSAARDIRAFPVEELLGCTLSEVLCAFGLEEEAEGIEPLVREVLETGMPRRDVLLTGRPRYELHAEVTALVSFFRPNDARGRLLGVAAAIVDVTERYQARARLALLQRASTRIGTTLDVFRTVQELADAAVPERWRLRPSHDHRLSAQRLMINGGFTCSDATGTSSPSLRPGGQCRNAEAHPQAERHRPVPDGAAPAMRPVRHSGRRFRSGLGSPVEPSPPHGARSS